MGNEMHLVEATFHLGSGQEGAAEAALRQVARVVLETNDMRAGDIRNKFEGTERELEQLSLDELVECWGWSFIRELANETDEIIGIQFFEDFSSDEESLFEALAPYISAGSYIDLEGERLGLYWQKRYGFTGSGMVELDPIFPAIPLTNQFSRDKIQAVLDADRETTELTFNPVDLYRLMSGYLALAVTPHGYFLCFLLKDEDKLKSVLRIPLARTVMFVDTRFLVSILAQRCLGATRIALCP